MEASGIRVIYFRDKEAEFSFYDIADIHFLNRGCSKIHLSRDVQTIYKNPLAYFGIGGDYGDFISPFDKRFDASCFDIDLKVIDLNRMGVKIVELMKEYFHVISDRCIGVLWGNHDKKYLSLNSQEFIHDQVCDNLNAPNMGYSGFVDIYFVHNPRMKKPSEMKISFSIPEKFTAKLRIFIHHGAGASNTAGGKINRLKELVNMVEADLVMMGHVHEQMAKTFLRLSANDLCNEIGQKPTMGLITGSYLKTYSEGFTGYGEIKAYAPATLGATRARYTPLTMELVTENKADNVGTRGNQ
jgi:predicted phosphodiesterase